MEHIDVTFGGRSVRLKPCGDHAWQTDNLRLVEYGDGDFRAFREPFRVDGYGDSPQGAVSDLESKLRDLRDQLTSILGE